MPKVERGKSDEELVPLRHSTAHVMAGAVLELFPQAKLGIGPAIKDGFYYDFDLPRALTPEDLAAIEAKMREVVRLNAPFERSEMPRDAGLRFFRERGQELKVELIEGLEEDEGAAGAVVSTYRHADFIDLCKGPHVARTGEVGAFKLMSVAGAYWRGDEKRPMLQRIYGTAWPSQADLKAYLEQLAEIERRDHRVLGKRLELFMIDDEVGAGMVLWLPNGAVIREELENWWRQQHHERGYNLVYTPHLGTARLYAHSGHLENFAESMFGPIELEPDFYVKPMNCPGHIKIFQSRVRSYRELPLRIAEIGAVYRNERGGTLHGMLRVRSITQDDSHVFCMRAQLQSEIEARIDFEIEMLRVFGYDFRIELSTRPEKRLGDDALWDDAEGVLRQAVEAKGLQAHLDKGGGAFYGPKLSFMLLDAIGREWQGCTIQLDYNLPERFDITYDNATGERERPAMIHSVLYGALERFVGGLIEHYAGNFPLWLSWLQVVVISIRPEQNDRAREIVAALRERGFRAEADDRPTDMRAKIKHAQERKANYMLLVGKREAESGMVSIRPRHGEQQQAVPLGELIARLESERRTMELPADFQAAVPSVAEAVAEQRGA